MKVDSGLNSKEKRTKNRFQRNFEVMFYYSITYSDEIFDTWLHLEVIYTV